MASVESIAVWGLICLAAGIALILAGIILFMISAKNRAKGNKSITKIVIGCLLMFFGIPTVIASGIYLHSLEWISKAPTAPEIVKMVEDITEALETNDPDALAELFAEEGYSGDALTASDATELFEDLDGEVATTRNTVAGISFEDMTHSNSYAFKVTTDTNYEYTVFFDFIIASDNDAYIGIQHIEVVANSETIDEFGIVPDLENRS